MFAAAAYTPSNGHATLKMGLGYVWTWCCWSPWHAEWAQSPTRAVLGGYHVQLCSGASARFFLCEILLFLLCSESGFLEKWIFIFKKFYSFPSFIERKGNSRKKIHLSLLSLSLSLVSVSLYNWLYSSLSSLGKHGRDCQSNLATSVLPQTLFLCKWSAHLHGECTPEHAYAHTYTYVHVYLPATHMHMLTHIWTFPHTCEHMSLCTHPHTESWQCESQTRREYGPSEITLD